MLGEHAKGTASIRVVRHRDLQSFQQCMQQITRQLTETHKTTTHYHAARRDYRSPPCNHTSWLRLNLIPILTFFNGTAVPQVQCRRGWGTFPDNSSAPRTPASGNETDHPRNCRLSGLLCTIHTSQKKRWTTHNRSTSSHIHQGGHTSLTPKLIPVIVRKCRKRLGSAALIIRRGIF